jgi:diacylglycerol kinase (ATP)
LKTCIIFNPVARGEKARDFRNHLEDMAGDAAFKPTWGPGAATELAREAVEEGFEDIVAAGGDGTLNEVLNGLATASEGLRRARLGVLPLGTVNVFAKEIGMATTPLEAWRQIREGHERTIDLPFAEWTEDGQARIRHFAQLAGAGLDAEAIALVSWGAKRRLRQLAYVQAGIRALLRRPMQIKVKCGGCEHPAELVLVGNGRYYGGRLPVFPEASLTDGQLDVCVFPKVRPWTVAMVGMRLVLGRFKPSRHALHLRTDALELTTTTGARFEVEGDLAGSLPVRMGLRPGALRVIVPPGLP